MPGNWLLKSLYTLHSDNFKAFFDDNDNAAGVALEDSLNLCKFNIEIVSNKFWK